MRSLALSLLLAFVTVFHVAHADMLTLDHPAPDFQLSDQNNDIHTLADYRGQWLVLYFYPKNDTPGCTTEACSFRDEYKVITALNTQVLGVSIDDQASHADFADKYSLPFPLLADKDGIVAKSYGALAAIGPIKFAKRHTIIISPEGTIKKIYRSVNVSRHSQQVIADLKGLSAETGAY